MEILNIGALEFVFIVLLAFIVLGPKKAVEAAGDLGRWIRKVVKSPLWQEVLHTTREIQDIPRTIMDDDELKHTLDEIERSAQEVNDSLRATRKETQAVLHETLDEADPHRIFPGKEQGSPSNKASKSIKKEPGE